MYHRIVWLAAAMCISATAIAQDNGLPSLNLPTLGDIEREASQLGQQIEQAAPEMPRLQEPEIPTFEELDAQFQQAAPEIPELPQGDEPEFSLGLEAPNFDAQMPDMDFGAAPEFDTIDEAQDAPPAALPQAPQFTLTPAQPGAAPVPQAPALPDVAAPPQLAAPAQPQEIQIPQPAPVAAPRFSFDNLPTLPSNVRSDDIYTMSEEERKKDIQSILADVEEDATTLGNKQREKEYEGVDYYTKRAMSRKKVDNFRTQVLPESIYKKRYSGANAHLPRAVTEDDLNRYMFTAAVTNQIEGVRAMLDYGRDINLRDENGNTPLLAATTANNIDAVRLLLRRGADANIKNNEGMTPAHIAAYRGNMLLLQGLMHVGAHPDVSNQFGNTPLMSAIVGGHNHIVEFLVDKANAEINIRNNRGLTPLHLAAYGGQAPVVETLLKHGADPLILTANGQKAEELAIAQRHSGVALMLEDAARNIKQRRANQHASYEQMMQGFIRADRNFDKLMMYEKREWNEKRHTLMRHLPEFFNPNTAQDKAILAERMAKWDALDTSAQRNIARQITPQARAKMAAKKDPQKVGKVLSIHNMPRPPMPPGMQSAAPVPAAVAPQQPPSAFVYTPPAGPVGQPQPRSSVYVPPTALAPAPQQPINLSAPRPQPSAPPTYQRPPSPAPGNLGW